MAVGTDFCADVSMAAWLCLFLQEMLRCCRQVGKAGSVFTLGSPLDCWTHT